MVQILKWNQKIYLQQNGCESFKTLKKFQKLNVLPENGTYILGISHFYHDSAASLIRDGEIVTAVQEKGFWEKHDSRFPKNAINYCLNSNLDLRHIEKIVYYEKPLLTFERLLTYLAVAPRGRSFIAAMQVWLRKAFLKSD